MSDERLHRLRNLANRGSSVLAAISQEINGQAILGFAELISKAITLEFDSVERELLWQAGGFVKSQLPNPIERVLEQYVGWFMDCTLLFSELDWHQVPRIQNFKSARTEMANELLRSNPSLQVVLKIVERQVRLLEDLYSDPPSKEAPKEEEIEEESGLKARRAVIAFFVLICIITDILLVTLFPLELMIGLIGSEIAVLSLALGVWKFLRGED